MGLATAYPDLGSTLRREGLAEEGGSRPVRDCHRCLLLLCRPFPSNIIIVGSIAQILQNVIYPISLHCSKASLMPRDRHRAWSVAFLLPLPRAFYRPLWTSHLPSSIQYLVSPLSQDYIQAVLGRRAGAGCLGTSAQPVRLSDSALPPQPGFRTLCAAHNSAVGCSAQESSRAAARLWKNYQRNFHQCHSALELTDSAQAS